MPTNDSQPRRWLGRTVFIAGLAFWACASLRLLPYGFHDLHYLFSFQNGIWGPAEWVHPLFLPFLGALQAGLSLFGYGGRMLMPLELLNLAVSGLALVALFRLAERLRADSLTAALAVLLLGFTPGFWAGALRPDPYALAAAGTVACLLMLIAQLPAQERRRFALAGAAAGLTIGLHVSALALVPVAALAAVLEAGWDRRSARLFGAFLAGLACAVLASYAAFAAFHRIPLGYFQGTPFSEIFSKIEQMPMTSIYSSGSPLKQAADFLHTLKYQATGGLLLLAAAFSGLALLVRRWRPAFDQAQTRGLALGAASLLFYSLFFLINNSCNGFLYAGVLTLPVILGVLVREQKLLRAAFAPAALLLLANSAGERPPYGPQDDPMWKETKFLDALLKPGDLVVVPGCPSPEVLFQRHLNILMVGDMADAGTTWVPQSPLAETPAWIAQALGQGRRVFFAPGNLQGSMASPQDNGFEAQKRRQIFWVSEADSPEAARRFAALRKSLSDSFKMDCAMSSPQGWRYCRLSLKRAGRPGPEPAAPASLSEEKERVARLYLELPRSIENPHARLKVRYLLDWLAEAPQDGHARDRLVSLVLEQGKVLRLASRHKEAEAAFRKALEIDPASAPAWMRLGASLATSQKGSEAAACFDKVLSLAPQDRDLRADALAERAGVLAAAGQPAQALQDRRQALKTASPDWPRRQETEAALSREDARQRVENGIALFRKGRKAEAETAFRAALKLDPANIAAHMSLGALLDASSRSSQAVACYDRILALKPEGQDLRADTLAARANAFKSLGQAARAREDLAEALKTASPKWPWRKQVEAALAR